MKPGLCEVCKTNLTVKSSIVRDYYYARICQSCYDHLTASGSVSAGAAEYDRGRDSEEHEADGIQPISGGKISPEFIHLYPDQARQLFSEEEIDKATRS